MPPRIMRVGKVGVGVLTKNKPNKPFRMHSASVSKVKGIKPIVRDKDSMGSHTTINRKYAVAGAAYGVFGHGKRGARSQNKHPQAGGPNG